MTDKRKELMAAMERLEEEWKNFKSFADCEADYQYDEDLGRLLAFVRKVTAEPSEGMTGSTEDYFVNPAAWFKAMVAQAIEEA